MSSPGSSKGHRGDHDSYQHLLFRFAIWIREKLAPSDQADNISQRVLI
jgi:hypothetical protein